MQALIKPVLALSVVAGLAACDTDLERGVTGATIGGVAASATNNNVAAGAAAGALAGVYCDDAGICR
ncbi:hypothetical protein [Tropicimonas sp. IMCC34011]|uniref:hypothetical protein n=1 Tax=Tropicimonas sp. IMCC34011 TaxID=2248759 RepID=UPI000E24FF80|nr:hypothetical protein [Tropicimonas sp. IMCC34011]